MIFVLLLLVCGIMADYFKRSIEETIPVCLFGVMFFLYGIALLGYISHAVDGIAIGSITVIVFYIFYKRNNLKELISVFIQYSHTGFLIYIIVVIGVIIAFSNHIITNWDDLNYWAMFPRNMYEINGLPTGSFNCTLFKDYSPIVQLLYYFLFKATFGFSEAMMYQTNNILLYTLLLPMFCSKNLDKKNHIMYVMIGILFPSVAMFQQLQCIGVDCILSFLFGYLLYYIIFEKKKDFFYYLNLSLGASVLILVKSVGLLLVIILLILILMMSLRNRNQILFGCCSMIPSFAAFFSWKIFCDRRGNTSYLHERVVENISSIGFLNLPEYTGETVRNFIKNFFFFHLNGGRLGVTPILLVLFFVLVIGGIYQKANRDKREKNAFIILFIGFFFYCLSLLYMYLFVFDEWEAISLSSYDRYLSIYLLAMVYVVLLGMKEHAKQFVRVNLVLLFLMVLTLNYPMLFNNIIPSTYASINQKHLLERETVENHFSKLKQEFPQIKNSRLLIVNEKEDQGLNKYQQYAAVPIVTETFASSLSTAELSKKEIMDKIQNRSIDFVYYYDTNELYEYNKDLNIMEKVFKND